MNFEHGSLVFLSLALALLLLFFLADVRLGKKLYQMFKLNIKPWNSSRNVKHLLALFGVASLFIALLGPKGNPHYSQLEVALEKRAQYTKEILDVVIVLDVSSSMGVTDTPTREARLKTALDTLDDLLQKVDQSYLTLYLFTSTLEKKCPRTLDQVFFRLLLKSTSVNETGVPGTDFKTILADLSKEKLNDDQIILFVSDGDDTAMEALSPIDKTTRLKEIKELIKHPMITVGVGSAVGGEVPKITYKGKPAFSKLNSELLKSMGTYIDLNASNSSDLIQALKNYVVQIKQKGSSTDKRVLYDDYYQYPLGLALILLLASYLLPSTWSRTIPLILVFAALQAESPELSYDAGDFGEARALFENMEPKNSWEKGVIPLDVSLSYLGDKKIDEAAQELSRLEISPKSSPYYLRKFHQTKALIWKESASYNAPFLLELSLREILLAEQAHCELEKLKEVPTCRTAFILNQIKTAIKEDLEEIQEKAADPSWVIPLWIDRVKKGDYKAFLNDPELKFWTDDDLKEALRNLRQGDSNEGLQYLQKASIKFPSPLNPLENPFISFQSQLDWIESPFQLLAKENPADHLKQLVGAVYALIGYKAFKSLDIQKQMKEVRDSLTAFPKIAYEYQVKSFFEKGCEKINWRAVFPLYAEALKWAELSDNYSLYNVIIYLKKALKVMEDPYNNPPPSDSSETIRSFQDLMLQDQKAPADIQGGSSVEKPW